MELIAAATAAAARFAIDSEARDVRPHAGGHIHRSFVVDTGERRFLLQRVNTHVFPRPELVMENIAAVTAYLARRGHRTVDIVAARDGGALVRDGGGGVWRMFRFIEDAVTHERAEDAAAALSAARAFGDFQRALADYDGPPLHATIPGFHDSERRVAALEAATASDAHHRVVDAADLLARVEHYRDALASVYARAQSSGEAMVRIAHHDAKIANVLFDARTDAAICVVDLDTVMPGLSLYDFGDLVRSMVSTAAEDDRAPARAEADPSRFQAIVRGYLEGAESLLAPSERALLPSAAEAMVFEQGVRFLTDHLDGDTYFRIDRTGQNLDRARVQFALLDSLVAHRAEFTRMVAQA